MAPEGVRFRGTRSADAEFLEEKSKEDGVVQLPSGLQYKILKEQPDKKMPYPKISTVCQCHYRGKLVDGTEFDSSYKRGKPSGFAPNQVVAAWTEAMQLMREGDKWELYVPAALGYADRGAGNVIPPGAALVFELEMVKVGSGSDDGPFPYWAVFAVLALIGLYFGIQHFSGSAVDSPVVSLADASDPANPRVFFDMGIGGNAVGRVEIELFSKVTPKTAENFRALSTGEINGKSGKPLAFKGSKFHRVIPGFMCQGGDITRGNGMGGESIYGSNFNDEWEHGMVKHTEPFMLSMANRGKNTQSSQFFITVAATPWLDGKHVVFGKVVAGTDIMRQIEKVGSGGGTPSQAVTIMDSGELKTVTE